MGGPDRLPVTRCQTREATKATTKKKKQILAISEAPEAMPPKPKTAAMIATTKKPSDQLNIAILLNVDAMYDAGGVAVQGERRRGELTQRSSEAKSSIDSGSSDEPPPFGLIRRSTPSRSCCRSRNTAVLAADSLMPSSAAISR